MGEARQRLTSERWAQINTIFDRAVAFPPEGRARFLDEVCGADGALRAEVERLLACDSEDHSFLTGAIREAAHHLTSSATQIGRRIGPYRLTAVAGKGGMGTVYVAVREGEFRQTVALKLINRGMDTDAIVDRFLRERQLLADLDHPYIARLIDGGSTDDELPYLVMERVEGINIVDYCRTLGVRDRLALFRRVCSAVQYAHGRLIVHRDIKPSNILVTADGTPKLLDFGVATLLAPDPHGSTTRLPILTPKYSSPEQARGAHATTATDVYSLGVVLREMLEDNCTGELETIAAKASAEEPERRYRSVEQLSGDVGNFLAGRPLSARRAGSMYRARKFAGRNRVAVASLCAFMLAVIIGATTAVYQARRAELRFEQLRQLARSTILDVGDELQQRNTLASRERLLQNAAAYLDGLGAQSGRDPRLLLDRLEGYEQIARLQMGPAAAPGLGKKSEALENWEKGRAIAERLVALHPADRTLTVRLAAIHVQLGELSSGDSAAVHQQRVIELLSPVPATDRTRRMHEVLTAGERGLALAYLAAGDLDLAEGAVRRYLSPDRDDAVSFRRIESDIMAARGDLVRSAAAFERLRASEMTVGEAESYLARTSDRGRIRVWVNVYLGAAAVLGNSAGLHLGRPEAALENVHKAIAFEELRLRYSPPDTTRYKLAECYSLLSALELDGRVTVDAARRALELSPPEWMPRVRAQLGSALLRAGRAREAVEHFEWSVAQKPAAGVYLQLGDTLLKRGDAARAFAAYEAALRNATADVKAKPYRMISRMHLADAHEGLAQRLAANGDTAAAVKHYEHSLEIWSSWRNFGYSSPFDAARRERVERRFRSLTRSRV